MGRVKPQVLDPTYLMQSDKLLLAAYNYPQSFLILLHVLGYNPGVSAIVLSPSPSIHTSAWLYIILTALFRFLCVFTPSTGSYISISKTIIWFGRTCDSKQ